MNIPAERSIYKGYKYEETKNLSTAETAKLIRKECRDLIKKEYPEVKISVKSTYFSGGSAIDIIVKETGFNPFTPEYIEYRKTDMRELFVHQNHYNDKAKELLKKLNDIARQYLMEDIDTMTDYFDVSFYLHVELDWELKRDLLKKEVDHGKAWKSELAQG